jgi:hypothetical protein
VNSRGKASPDIRVQFLHKGQVATLEMDGAFARLPVPSDGLLIESKSATLFITVDDIRGAGVEVSERTRRFSASPDCTAHREDNSR